MTTTEDILKAMAAEKQKMLASSVKPQLRPNLTNADIVRAHHEAVKPAGRPEDRRDSKLGAPKAAADPAFAPKVNFEIPASRRCYETTVGDTLFSINYPSPWLIGSFVEYPSRGNSVDFRDSATRLSSDHQRVLRLRTSSWFVGWSIFRQGHDSCFTSVSMLGIRIAIMAPHT